MELKPGAPDAPAGPSSLPVSLAHGVLRVGSAFALTGVPPFWEATPASPRRAAARWM